MLSGVIKVLRVMVYGSATHNGEGVMTLCVKGCPFVFRGREREEKQQSNFTKIALLQGIGG